MSTLNPQAVDLNEIIERTHPQIVEMFSQRGRGIFFPKKGILAQAADAKGKEINATIGIALEDDGSPLRLGCIEDRIHMEPADIFPYAPSYGRPDLRETWREMIYSKNPGLEGIDISNPVVSSALTHGLSICGYLFADEGDRFYTTDLFWGNYRLIFNNAYNINLITYPTFDGSGLNTAALREVLQQGPVGKRIVSLNFPNNPTGYTLSTAEADEITTILVECAEAGNVVVALIDDAYFGLVYEDGVSKESIFSNLANAHDRILAVKLDGATKEDYAWGFRVGFITYGIKDSTAEVYGALEAKTAGAIRGNISNSPNISQSIINQAYNSPDYARQKQEKFATLEKRYNKIKEILSEHPEYAEAFTPLPFNSGYFMCLKTVTADPETVRQLLLNEYSTGIIVANGVIRVAFSSTPFPDLEKLFDNIYQATRQAGDLGTTTV